MSGYFPFCSLRHDFQLSLFPSQNGLKQHWLPKSNVKELLAQKGFCWSSTGWPEHALERGVSFATAGETASPTHSSLKSKQRAFCCPRQLLLVWKHLVLLVPSFLPLLALRLQKSASLQSSNEEQKLLQSARGCCSRYQSQPNTNYPLENQKIFLS